MEIDEPEERNSFVSPWDECTYLLDCLEYWYWGNTDSTKTVVFAYELDRILRFIGRPDSTLRGAQGTALVAAVFGEWDKCLKAKRDEIDMLRFLLADGVPASVTDADDLAIAVEEFVLFAGNAGSHELSSELIAEVSLDKHLEQRHRDFLAKLDVGGNPSGNGRD